jgi:hypothetical protein
VKYNFNKNLNYGIIAHDAGGAEIISSLLLFEKLKFNCYLEGPARNIFNDKIKNFDNSTLEKIIKFSDIIILGSSWQSDLEYNALRLARKYNKYTITILDHWVNYLQRFERNSKLELPDIILTCDKFALQIAKSEFKNFETSIYTIENYYFKQVKDDYNKLNITTRHIKFKYLYLCEPIIEPLKKMNKNIDFYGFNEFDIMNIFLKKVKIDDIILIRLHPSEQINKYDQILKSANINYVISNNKLIDDISVSEIVYGWCTMALVISKILGKKIIFFEPKNNPCLLNNIISKIF